MNVTPAFPAVSVQLWSPWHTPVSSEETAAGSLSPSAESESQTAPGVWPPGNPACQRKEVHIVCDSNVLSITKWKARGLKKPIR